LLLSQPLPPLPFAQERTLKILVGFPPGGSVDVIARLLAEKLRASLGQNVIVDNKPGAGGRVALNEVKRAAPDGQTLVLSPSGALVIQPWLYCQPGLRPRQGLHGHLARDHIRLCRDRWPRCAPAGDLKAVLGLDEGQPGQGQLRDLGRWHGAALCGPAAGPGRRCAHDARGLPWRRTPRHRT
jgi:hypothetical protein